VCVCGGATLSGMVKRNDRRRCVFMTTSSDTLLIPISLDTYRARGRKGDIVGVGRIVFIQYGDS
jgi:hypothetical protein